MTIVRDIDKGYNTTVEVLREMEGAHVTIGVHAEDDKPYLRGQDEPVTTADVATFHEFGAPKANVPARPFMRPTIDDNEDEYLDMLERGVKNVVDQRVSIGRILGLLGLKISDDITTRIVELQRPPLHPKTIEAKKRGYGREQNADVDPDEPIKLIEGPEGNMIDSGNPLVDTAQLKRSIDFQVKGVDVLEAVS
ncbi:MAG: hypothetical protein ABEN55_12180 [Bradymonadaceae bacterium]